MNNRLNPVEGSAFHFTVLRSGIRPINGQIAFSASSFDQYRNIIDEDEHSFVINKLWLVGPTCILIIVDLMFWAHAMKRVTAGAHLPTPWLFEPAKRPDDRADYCLYCSFLP